MMEYFTKGVEYTNLKAIHIDKKFSETQILFEEEIKRELKGFEDITILSDCNEHSILYKQCKFNNINLVKLDYANVLDQLNKINSKYIFFVRGDAVLVSKLKVMFTYEQDKKIIIAGINHPLSNHYPAIGHYELHLNGTNKFINPNMIFGRRTTLIEFFEDYSSYCNSNFGIEPFKTDTNLYDVWFADRDLYDEYVVDSVGDTFNSIDKGNYNMYEEDGMRILDLINFQEKKFRLF